MAGACLDGSSRQQTRWGVRRLGEKEYGSIVFAVVLLRLMAAVVVVVVEVVLIEC